MANYYPRALVRFAVPVMGSIESRTVQATSRETISFDLPPKTCRYERNDFNAADEANFTFDLGNASIDPRLLSNANVSLCLMDVRSNSGVMSWRDDAVRFSGIAVSTGINMRSGLFRMRALDFTTFFLKQKPLLPQHIPDYSQTLTQAWARICDGVGLYDYDRKVMVSSVEILRDRIELRGIDDIRLGDAVLERVRKLGKLQVALGADAWHTWKACTDSLGLYTWIDGDRCIVSTASDYYTSNDPPVFQYGLNCEDLDEDRDLQALNGRGIHLTSYEPISGTTLEAFFPPRESGIVVKKRVPAGKKKMGLAALAPVNDYESHVYPHANVVTQDILEECAERIYEERSRQELQGFIDTKHMRVLSASGKEVDVLGLNHGDSIIARTGKDVSGAMRMLQTQQARMNYLIERGTPSQLAKLIAEDAGFTARLLSSFALKRVSVDFDGDMVSTKVDYVSRINPNTGSTQ